MKSLVFREILSPLASRVGTAAAAFLLGVVQADPTLAHEAGAVIASALLVSVDLVTSYILRRRKKEAS